MNEFESFSEVYDCGKVAHALRMVLLDYLGRYAATGYAFEVIETLPAMIELITIVELSEPEPGPPPDLMAPE